MDQSRILDIETSYHSPNKVLSKIEIKYQNKTKLFRCNWVGRVGVKPNYITIKIIIIVEWNLFPSITLVPLFAYKYLVYFHLTRRHCIWNMPVHPSPGPFSSLKIVTVMWCMPWVFHWAEYTKVKASLKYRETIACTKLTTIKVWGINTTHLKILHTLKVLPNTTRI